MKIWDQTCQDCLGLSILYGTWHFTSFLQLFKKKFFNLLIFSYLSTKCIISRSYYILWACIIPFWKRDIMNKMMEVKLGKNFHFQFLAKSPIGAPLCTVGRLGGVIGHFLVFHKKCNGQKCKNPSKSETVFWYFVHNYIEFKMRYVPSLAECG